LLDAIRKLVELAIQWLNRQHLRIDCDRQLSPDVWVENILDEAKGKSGGKVEQHLVGAKLARRHPDLDIPNNPGHAGDVQTGRPGDFLVGTTAYHVTASPSSDVLKKCKANLGAGLYPFLLVPRAKTSNAQAFADEQGIAKRMRIAAIEDFLADNIVEMSNGDQQLFISTMKSIVESYNERLVAVETDLSLKIEIR
jgi:hypothetical protein